ncbi:murein DD-endopeptidase [Pseudomonas sp. TE6288]|jgi:cell wall-associated NlpC family hydrolase|uniref:C40 family peptidase n=1 Tax=Pseudomonas TaxID=286 RepID=UPI000C87ECE5|nr:MULTISPECIES: NlpC/P60 family protein [Pseudomonas]MDF9753906.1 cell wall-associated NlpC family hydrolase [Pseudomonas hunanensis]PNA02593.1 peptidase P60 [Pseudomonas sp. FW305-42]PNA26905.1 peptidase P60 [Pseudomonas sp. MPR-R1B]PNB27703.1 peptidase P60 [Pseudomonas sp. DP16D-E2]PNB44231.1 peptidase P60 [Pseudomonas sp. FW305-17]
MPPFIKTWLTLCLLLPLAAHATNREQRLPSGFTGYTTNADATVKRTPIQYRSSSVRARPANAAKQQQAVGMQAVAMSPKQSSEVLSRAVNVLGTPYRWGGSSPKKGFDCSGLVKYAFNDVADVDLPRTSNAMAQGQGVKVAKSDLKPGDLIFFNIKSRRVNHVAIYLGNDRFIHAPRTGKRVSIDSLEKPYWQKHYVVAKRVLPKNQQTLALAKR